MDVQALIGLVGNVGIGGILAWYLWYTTSVQQPRQAELQNEILRRIIDEFRADMQLERDHRNGLRDAITDLTAEMRQRPCIAKQASVNSLS